MLQNNLNSDFVVPLVLSSPKKISFKLIDYFKVFYSWMFAFRQTFSIEPGLYYTGREYDIKTPMLATCNYHMTVFGLWRKLKSRNVRILVIDTKGINVWCSSSKGQFSAEEISKQLTRYKKETLTENNKITLVLPKLSLSGVSIAELKKRSIVPKIGPVYTKDLPDYLDDLPLRNRNKDKFQFSLKDRLFTLLPSLVQVLRYGIYITIGLFIWHYFFNTGIYWQVLPIFVIIVVIYTILFPLLPTKKFAVKGLVLYAVLIAVLSIYYFQFENSLDRLTYIFYLAFLGGSNLYFSLSYTGNSGVSNYTLVKKEIIMFLPITVLFFLASLVTVIIKGVM